MAENFGASVIELRMVEEVLHEDAKAAYEVAKTGSEREKRNYVRAVFAYIEGTIFRLKHLAQKTTPDYAGERLTETELGLCRDVAFHLNEKGDVYEKAAKLQLIQNVRLAFRVVVKAMNANYQLPTEPAKWEQFHRAVKVRDRLMHPKTMLNLTVTDDELKDTEAAFGAFRIWYMECLVDIAAVFTERNR